MLHIPQSLDNINLFRSANGWQMDQKSPDELQTYPQYPLLFGVDGRFTDVIRRFRGFKRLDFDIRHPYSNSGYANSPIIHSSLEGKGPNTFALGQTGIRQYGPHDWLGVGTQRASATPDITNPQTVIYQFIAGTLDRSRRSEALSDRRPVSAFLIHGLDSDGLPFVKIMGRALGDRSMGSLFQTVLVGQGVYPTSENTPPVVLDLRLKDSDGEYIDWVGLGIIGRFVVVSHKGDSTFAEPSSGETWIFETPFKAYRGITQGSPYGLTFHGLDLPEVDFPQRDNGFARKGDRYMRGKLAGTRGWNWLHAIESIDPLTQTLTATAIDDDYGDDWTANTGTKLAAVAPPDDADTTYISTTADVARQGFIMGGSTITSKDRIVSLTARIRAKNQSASNYVVVASVRLNGVTIAAGNNSGTGGSYTNIVLPLSKPDGSEWTDEDLVGLSIRLISSNPSATEYVRVTTVSIDVVYVPARVAADNSIRFEGYADAALENSIVPHEARSKFRLRARLVNYTTGFVSPMGEPLQLAIGPQRNGVIVSWVPGTMLTDSDKAGVVEYTIESKARALFASVFGIETAGGGPTYTGLADPTKIERDGLYDVRLQLWVSQSVPDDNPSGGGGYYYLDQEIPVVVRRPNYTDPLFGSTGFRVWPGWVGDESLGRDYIGLRIPSKSNDELATQAIYIPEADDVGDLEPSEAFGNVGGALLSLSDGGNLTSGSGGAASGDIKCSPPWKFYPGNWVESTAPLFRHAIFPKGLVPAKFVGLGDLVFYVGQNRLVRIVRDGATVLADDIDISGGVNRDSVCGVGGRVLIVTSTGVEELNPTTLEVTTITQVQRIISEKWQSFAERGAIMSGYDPQLRAVFIAPRRDLTSSEWLRSEAIVIWTTTGRITMLSDCYWCGMSRGVHPLTGKEHLFFIDPVHNITYPNNSFDDSEPATMTGINSFRDIENPNTNRTRRRAVWTLEVLEKEDYDDDATIIIDGIPLQIGFSGSWDESATDTETVAESIRVAIADIMAAVINSPPEFNVSSVTRNASTLTITTDRVGSINDEYEFLSLLNIPSAKMVVTQTVTSEIISSVSPFAGGGAFQGTVTAYTGTTFKTMTDSALPTSGRNFDLYEWYNPHNEDGLGVQVVRSALIGAQVYFFRAVTDEYGITRTVLVADARVCGDTGDVKSLLFLASEINYHNGYTAIIVGDNYCVSPVVMQIVGAPIEAQDYPGSGIDQAVDVESLGVKIINRMGTAKESATRLPAANPLQGAIFLGVAFPNNLRNRQLGQVVTPDTSVGVSHRIDDTKGNPGELIWDEEDVDIITTPIGKGGNSIFPVLTLFGTDYNLDVVALLGRVVRRANISGRSPEGFNE